ncbi:hypothetical protein DL546_001332 [Coniochaeta pulveracea]|uniref:Uncharacterized protein n=1 Tax=Coniochaeta pulveracea TaxID=177199 RepID=A0A420Y0W7_9PEZI|nr:hypothetical protein DL546_001332 [Coniochaeta pulveracea]
MHMYTVLYFGLATAGLHYFALVLAEKYQRWQALRVFAKHHKTKPARRENPWDVLGIYKVVAMARLVIKGTSLDGAIDLFQRLGRTYSSKILTQPVLFTCDPRNMRHVLITAFTDFDSSRGIRDHLFRPITPHGIFALDGNEWKTARRLYRDHFSRTRDIVDLDLQERCFRNLEALIPSDNTPFDLQPLFLRLMLDLTTAFAMGVCVDSLRPDQSVEKKRFVDALIHVKKTMARDGFLGPVHVFLSKKEFHASCSTVQHFVEDIIRQKLAVSRPKDKSDSQEDVATAVESCFLDKLMEGSGDVIELRDGVLTLLIAGIDSVASLLSTATFLLSRHQAAQDKLRASILDKVGYELPSFNDLRGLAYLRYVFNETMRVYPPVPFNARTANQDTYLPVGGGPDGEDSVLVEKGARIVFSSWGSHRDLDNFGRDAHEFIPERWENLQADTLAGFIPFNLGPRACPGQNFALMEASYVVVRLLQTFSRIEKGDDKPWKENLGLNLSNKNGTVIKVVRYPDHSGVVKANGHPVIEKVV